MRGRKDSQTPMWRSECSPSKDGNLFCIKMLNWPVGNGNALHNRKSRCSLYFLINCTVISNVIWLEHNYSSCCPLLNVTKEIKMLNELKLSYSAPSQLKILILSPAGSWPWTCNSRKFLDKCNQCSCLNLEKKI